ncbi:MAG: 2'-5' RNA ligase family protein [Sphingobacteriaceae bacterium]|nr:2'-5' RNA ligase family protein [Sphingobacteriaceae bacterium]
MERNKKYFVAIIPPDSVFEKIENIKLEIFNEYKLKGALRSPSHITLHRPFSWKSDRENELIEKLGTFHFNKKFLIQLYNFNTFSPRVIYVDVKKSNELTDLHYLFMGFAKRELGLFNELNDLRGFYPHITIAFRDLKKQQFYKMWEKFEKKTFEDQFNYQGFSLLCLDKKWEILHNFTI